MIAIIHHEEDLVGEMEESAADARRKKPRQKNTSDNQCTVISLDAIESTHRKLSSNQDSSRKKKKPSHQGRSCQICRWEGRMDTTKNVFFCKEHRIRACLSLSRPYKYRKGFEALINSSPADSLGWLCPNTDMSCWEKAHSFYIPKGLFGKIEEVPMEMEDENRHRSVRTKPSSQLQKLKDAWEVSMGIKEVPRRKPGPTSKKRGLHANQVQHLRKDNLEVTNLEEL